MNSISIIAEIGTSHNGDIQKAYALIDAAKASGADFAKFQIVYADEILHPNTDFVQLPTGNIRLYDRFKELEQPFSFYEQMKAYCEQLGIGFLASPFGLKSLKELRKLNPKFIKIASPELNHEPLLIEASRSNIPLIMSTGVSKLADIERAVELTEECKNRVLLHCITSYPAPEQEYNVRFLEVMSQIFGLPVGISDHSLDPVLVPVLAMSCGAVFLEKHICLSKQDAGLDDPVALEPNDFALMVSKLRQAETMEKNEVRLSMIERYGRERVETVLGTGVKKLAESEKANYGRTNRSIHVMRDLKARDVLDLRDLAILRTEKVLTPGLEPRFLQTVLGARLSRDIENGQGLQWRDVILK